MSKLLGRPQANHSKWALDFIMDVFENWMNVINEGRLIVMEELTALFIKCYNLKY
jgi:hypothetical protein